MLFRSIDNYDSFTYNLVQYFGELGERPRVVRNDELTVDAVGALNPDAIVLSPGPGAPAHAGICIPVIRRYGASIPLLGVCLGHQAIGEAYGGTVIRAPRGVMLSHGAILCNCQGAIEVLKPLGLENNIFLSFLPLSHAYEHSGGQFFPISIGAQIYYAEGADTLVPVELNRDGFLAFIGAHDFKCLHAYSAYPDRRLFDIKEIGRAHV